MPAYHVLYNPSASGGKGKDNAFKLKSSLQGESLEFHDITEIENYTSFFGGLGKNDKVIISGGDGTLNRFVNNISDIDISAELYYHASGSGNDFAKDIGMNKGIIQPLEPFIENLPIATVNGENYRFINGIGYGIDGYVCEEYDKKRENGKKSGKLTYSIIALAGLLFFYKKRNAKITVDGVTKYYKDVWLAPTMNGRYYGGGIMISPDQNRLNSDGTVSLIVAHEKSRLRLLTVFPKIYSGKHLKHTDIVEVLNGHNISVSFDTPCALQIDGETKKNVLSYSVKALCPSHNSNKETMNV